jgi:hypothetical protein
VTDDADSIDALLRNSIDALLRKADQALDDARYLLADERVEAAMNRAYYAAYHAARAALLTEGEEPNTQNLFGGLSTATPVSTRSLRSQRCDFVDLVQNGFCIRPVVPLQGVIWAPFCNFAHCVSESYPSTKQVLTPAS